MALQRAVIAAMETPEQMALTDEAELAEELAADAVLGVYEGDKLVACAVLVGCRHSPHNIAFYLGYTPQQSMRCATLSSIFVAPTCRGFGLQRLLGRLCLHMAQAMGAREVFATVSPQNAPSLRNLEALGFSVLTRTALYNGRDRFILCRQLAGSTGEN